MIVEVGKEAVNIKPTVVITFGLKRGWVVLFIKKYCGHS